MSVPPTLPPLSEDEIVIVTGLPRSGTSLVMQMLAAAGVAVLTDDARPPDADNPRGYFEYAAVKRLPNDARWLDAAQGRALKIVVPLVRTLPASVRCRVLWVRRALPEVMASQRAMLARQGHEPPSGDDAALARAFTRELAETEHWLAARAAGRWCVVEHERLVVDPQHSAARIAALVGLSGLDVAAMVAAVDPALHRQRS